MTGQALRKAKVKYVSKQAVTTISRKRKLYQRTVHSPFAPVQSNGRLAGKHHLDFN